MHHFKKKKKELSPELLLKSRGYSTRFVRCFTIVSVPPLPRLGPAGRVATESSHTKPEELPKKNETEKKVEREELFHLNIQIKKGIVQAIIDPGSQKNLISEDLVSKMSLETEPHPEPYVLGWIKKGVELRVTRQCTFKFAITGRYIDTVTCEVVPLDVSHVVFGSPYIYDRDGIFYRREQKYRFVLDGRNCFIHAVKQKETIDLVTATQVRRMLNAYGKAYVCLLRKVEEPVDTSQVLSHDLSSQEKTEMKNIIQKFSGLFREPRGLPPNREIEHSIQLVDGEPLPNLSLYRQSLLETEEIKKQVQEMLE
jgi:hypothetical protein